MRLTVTAVAPVASGVLQISLRAGDGSALPAWQPGAHVDLHLPGGLIRQYSLCGVPSDRSTYQIAVLLTRPSRGGSAHIHSRMRAGDELEVTGPRNNFVLHPAERYLFVAGGIGITPLLAMIEEAGAAGASWSLLYGGRSRDSMVFADRVRAAGGGRVDLRPEDRYGLLDLDSWFARVDDRTLVYCCGPPPLLAAVEARAGRWPEGTLHLERFSPVAADPAPDRDVRVTCARSGMAVRVPAGTSLLGALRAAGVDVDSSCEEGVCGTCETKVLAGVPDHRDSVLSAAERRAGTQMMICVSRSQSEELVLDL